LIDLAALHQCVRVPRTVVRKRDLLIYLLRQAGGRTNQEIGDIFGLTYSAVSRRAALFKEKLAAGKSAAREYERVKAMITRRL
jgi:chromosomal replication initiation ATPase DnaA